MNDEETTAPTKVVKEMWEAYEARMRQAMSVDDEIIEVKLPARIVEAMRFADSRDRHPTSFMAAAWARHLVANNPLPPLGLGDIVKGGPGVGRLYIVVGQYQTSVGRGIIAARSLGGASDWRGYPESEWEWIDPESVDTLTLRALRACAFIEEG